MKSFTRKNNNYKSIFNYKAAPSKYAAPFPACVFHVVPKNKFQIHGEKRMGGWGAQKHFLAVMHFRKPLLKETRPF